MADRLFAAFYFAGLAASSLIRARAARRGRRTRVRQGPARGFLDPALMTLSALGMQVLPLVAVLSPALDFADYALPPWAQAAGVALLCASLALMRRAHRELGANWIVGVAVTAEQELVTRGLYARIRHPLYAAHWLAALAQPLLVTNWLAGWLTLVAFAPLYALRVRREEALLLSHFGEAYRRYLAATGRLIPRCRRQ